VTEDDTVKKDLMKDEDEEVTVFETSFDTPRTIPDEGQQIEAAKDLKKFVFTLRQVVSPIKKKEIMQEELKCIDPHHHKNI
jgi:hypothetical protein